MLIYSVFQWSSSLMLIVLWCVCWSDAVQQIGEVAHHINEHIKQQDNFTKMLAIHKRLSGPSAPKLIIPGRIFVKDGLLKKVGVLVYSLLTYSFPSNWFHTLYISLNLTLLLKLVV